LADSIANGRHYFENRVACGAHRASGPHAHSVSPRIDFSSLYGSADRLADGWRVAVARAGASERSGAFAATGTNYCQPQ